jgi:hypothetical protein
MARKIGAIINWLADCEEQDYPAALSYLSLTFEDKAARRAVAALRRAPITQFKAKDIFRASGLSLLGVSNFHVERDRRKIVQGKPLAPLLLLRQPQLARVIVADGYHRLCAVYSVDEDAVVPCKIA